MPGWRSASVAENGFLGVDPVFRFTEDDGGEVFQHVFRDFLAAVGGQAVEGGVVGGGVFQQLPVHLVGVEVFFLGQAFRFLAMESQTSVLMTEAPLTASTGSVVKMTFSQSRCLRKSSSGR